MSWRATGEVVGQPSKLDDIVAQRIVASLEKGLPRDTAARLARIAPRTFYNWLRRGKANEDGYLQFLQRVKEAEAKSEEALMGIIRAHAADTWQACAWLLERRMPKKYALRKPEPLTEAVTPEEADRLIAEAKKL